MPRRTLPLALLALLALGLAGCGFSVETGEAVSDVTTAPGLPVADDDGDAGATYLALPPARAVQEEAQEAAPRPFEWARYDETDGTLYVVWTTGVEPCNVLAGVDVVEESDAVTVTLLEGWLPDENGDAPTCIELAEQVSTPVALGAHLDGRAVIDGASGEPVTVEVVTAEDAASS